MEEKSWNAIYSMIDAYPISTPTLVNEHLIKLSSPEIDAKVYQHALCSLIYTMLGTLSDLGYAIMALGHHAANLGPDHQYALKCMFQYL